MKDFLNEFGLVLGATVLAVVLRLIAATVFGVFDSRKRRKERRPNERT